MSIESHIAPEWAIESLDGSEVPSLASFRGKFVLILIFSRGCPGCMGRAIPFSLELQKNYPELQTIAIHSRFEGPEYSNHQIEEVKLYFKLPYPLYKDQGKETYERYRAEGTPHWILLDKEGRVIRSMWGSMANVQNRLQYAMAELFGE
ncbi:MAG: TlpA disulfide reductase family protein [Bacteroidia bacterium]|nr:TlpA disulfide reductase family protein [Bacteroidia bacterium]